MPARPAVVFIAAAIAFVTPAAAADRGALERSSSVDQTDGRTADTKFTAVEDGRGDSFKPPTSGAVKRKPAPRVTRCRCGGEPEIASVESAPQR